MDAPRRAPGSGDGNGAGAGGWAGGVQVVTTTELTTTGGTVWGAARAALDFFEACPDAAGLAAPGARVLELGAGCGLLGLALARRLPLAAEMCLTEQGFGGALAHLRRNVAANAGMPGIERVTTAECDWVKVLGGCGGGGEDGGSGASDNAGGAAPSPAGQEASVAAGETETEAARPACGGGGDGGCESDTAAAAADAARLLATRWDYIVGSDLVYNKAGTHMLPRVMKRLALAGRGGGGACGGASNSNSSPPIQQAASDGLPPAPPGPAAAAAAVIYYAHTKHRYDARDVEFLEQCAAAGLAVEEVAPPGAPPRPPSPPPFTELYPEMRVAVWRITVAAGAAAE